MLTLMPPAVRYAQLPTEQPNPRTRALDRLPVERVLRLINQEDALVPRAVSRSIPRIAAAVNLIVRALRHGGRLFFLGAGTSGRLGVLEAAECPPTFQTPPSMVQALIAGGRPAVFRSREGAEDDRIDARATIRRRVRSGDAVVGIAASGITPFVSAGLQAAKARGASTILLTCHAKFRRPPFVDACIVAATGPEILAGSTRLKAGTATKLLLNMLTVASMVQLGKVYGHWMVDVRPTSRKLTARALRLIQQLGGVSPQQAKRLLAQSGKQVKVAIVMARRGLDAPAARALLAQHDGMLRKILAKTPNTKFSALAFSALGGSAFGGQAPNKLQ